MKKYFYNQVIYQVLLRAFCDSNGDGIGDIRGLKNKLEYIKYVLGASVVWITPFFKSSGADGGYDIVDYREIDPVYGTMDDFNELVKKAKSLGLIIMLDIVINHTSTEHEWFKKALDGDEKYSKYYIFKKGNGTNLPPNGIISKFGGSAWKYVPNLDKWYLHLFSEKQADLNWDNPDVRQECVNIINFWRAKGVQAFRFDVINLISKDDLNKYKSGDGRELYTDGPHIHEYLKELNYKSFGRNKKHISVGELSSAKINECVIYTNPKSKELDMIFSFVHLKVDYKNGEKWELKKFKLSELKEILFSWIVEMQKANAIISLVWECHDQPRSVSRFGNDKEYRKKSAMLLAGVLYLMHGVPCVFQGQEIGMTNMKFSSFDDFDDVESINAISELCNQGKQDDEILKILSTRSRDNARTVMQWNDSFNSGFSKCKDNNNTSLQVDNIIKPRINLNYVDINVKNDLSSKDSIIKFYKKLFKLRRTMRVLQDGKFIPILNDDEQIFAYKYNYKKEQLVCLGNFSNEESNVNLNLKEYQILLNNYDDIKLDKCVLLNPWQFVVFYTKKAVR